MLVVCAYAGLDSSVLAAGWFKGSHQPLSKPLMLVAATPTQRVSRAAPANLRWPGRPATAFIRARLDGDAGVGMARPADSDNKRIERLMSVDWVRVPQPDDEP